MTSMESTMSWIVTSSLGWGWWWWWCLPPPPAPPAGTAGSATVSTFMAGMMVLLQEEESVLEPLQQTHMLSNALLPSPAPPLSPPAPRT